jgi:hypothetical protein
VSIRKPPSFLAEREEDEEIIKYNPNFGDDAETRIPNLASGVEELHVGRVYICVRPSCRWEAVMMVSCIYCDKVLLIS